jgi:beta-carotene ketolase (CrtO type)
VAENSEVAEGSDYDVVVVGAGVNGLACGAYLAKAGLAVAVVERRNECGAFALTEDLFGAGHPTDTHAAVCFLPMSPVWGDLELDRYGFDLLLGRSAAAAVWPDGKNFVFYYDRERQLRELERFSPVDARTAAELRSRIEPDALELCSLIFREASEEGAERLSDLGRYAGIERPRFEAMTGLELLSELFEEEHVRLLWLAAADIGLFGDVALPGEGAVAVILSSLLATGTPRGGMHALTHALVRCLRAHRGALWLNAPVARVERRGGDGRGGYDVVLGEEAPYPGRELRARRAVVFNVAPPLARDMLGKEMLARGDPALLGKMDSWSSAGHCAFISHFLVRGLPAWGSRPWNPDVDVSPFVLRPYDSWEHALRSQELYHRGETMGVLGDVAEIYNQTALDRSRLGADGCCTVSVEIEYPVALDGLGGFGAWDRSEVSGRVHAAHLEMMERLAPGFRGQVVDSCYFTPLDNWRRNASAIFGHEIGGDNSGPQWYLGRMPVRSAIEGLYFSQGIWPASLTHLGNGYVAACAVAEDLGVRDQPWWTSAPMGRLLERFAARATGG